MDDSQVSASPGPTPTTSDQEPARLVQGDDDRHYLLDSGGQLAGVPDRDTWTLLQQAGITVDSDTRPPVQAPFRESVPSMAGARLFYTDGPDGTRRTFWSAGGVAHDVSHLPDVDREAAFGPALPLAAAFPGLTGALVELDAQALTLTPGQMAILTYLNSIPPPSITDPPGLMLTNGVEQPATYVGPGNVDYTVTVQDQTVKNVVDQFPVLSPVQDAIWPGAIIQGASLASGLLGLVQVADRAPGTLTISTELVVQNPGAPTSVTVPSPSAATVTTARRNLLHALAPTASSGTVTLDLGTVTTEQQVSTRLGAKVSGSSWNASADVNVSGSLETSRSYLKLTQEFYTVIFEPTGSPGWVFGPGVDVPTLKQYSGPGNAPAYIDQVTYGRIVLFSIDSSHTATTVDANVKAAWKAVVSGDVDAQIKVHNSTSSYQVQIAAVGATGSTVFRATTGLVDALKELSATADYTEDNPGAVIGYSARYLLDASVAKAALGPTSYRALLRADQPQTTTSYSVVDGPGGVQGGKRTGLVVRPGDHVSITALGHVWAGWWFGSWFGPAGDTSTHGRSMGNGTKPLADAPFSALLFGFGQGWYYWSDNADFTVGETPVRPITPPTPGTTSTSGSSATPSAPPVGSSTADLEMFVHINDDNVTNGKGGFSGQIHVRRRALPAVGPQ